MAFFTAVREDGKEKEWIRFFTGKGTRRVALLLAVLITMTVLLSIDLIPRRVHVEVGQPAPRDVEAPKSIVNTLLTNRKKEEAARAVLKEASSDPNFYEIDPTVSLRVEDNVDNVFNKIVAVQGEIARATAQSIDYKVESLQTQIRRSLGFSLTRETISFFLRQPQDRIEFYRNRAKDIASRIARENRISEENLPEVQAKVPEYLVGQAFEADEEQAITDVVSSVIYPNLTLDRQKIEAAQEEARKKVDPVRIQKGEIVLRKGVTVTPDDLLILEELGLLSTTMNYLTLIGILLICMTAIAFVGIYIYQFRKDILENDSVLSLIGLILVIITAAVILVSMIPSDATGGPGFLVPVAFGTMLIAILVDPRLAIITAVIFSFLVGIVMEDGLKFSIIAFIGGIAGIFSVSRLSDRSGLARAGLIVAGSTAIGVISVWLINSDFNLGIALVETVVIGILSAILTIGTLPFLENLFKITSTIKLLELANPNQPLLKRMLIEAPGTYHHSIIVGNLAESAADAVGGDNLLVRVGALYHDIGKLKRPFFFVENQLGQENPHDKISPSLSTLILTSHVKDGVDLARKHRLPEQVIDIIQQHHGTTLISYFYHKAAENDKEETVSEEDFRYPSSKPQSKEAAIVMLADATEAAVRSLSKPTPGRIEGLVRKIIKERLNDGQFDECDITLKDLDRIADAFVTVLSGIFHARVEYPESMIKELEGKKTGNGGGNKQSTG